MSSTNSSADAASSSRRARPRDGRATTFQSDPMMELVIHSQNNNYDCDEFGLVVVTGWPSDLSMAVKDSYQDFISRTKACFDKQDMAQGNVYFYPASCLHVTVATLYSVNHRLKDNAGRIELETFWRQAMDRAARMPDWPALPLVLTIDRTQIGERAGILLWNETTGGLDKMRKCIAQATRLTATERRSDDFSIDKTTLSIPPIAHSTFLRFPNAPLTDGSVLQENYSHVSKAIKDIFPASVELSDAKLVCEKTPYMHIPADERYVLASYPVGSNGS
jgi:hypothetical protein